MTLLVGSGEFWDALRRDIDGARSSVLVQTLSLEGDRTGRALAGAMARSGAPDRRVVVDEFTRWVQNDRFLWTPGNLLDGELRARVRSTRRMIRDLEAEGVGVRWVNPWGLLWLRAGARNHKKLVVIDDRVVYLGGFNFTDHNFSWHDMMLRVEDPEVGAFCRQDFEYTWAGRDVASVGTFPGLELMMLDVRENARLFGRVLARIATAREEILLETPYLSFPFTEALAEACARGVRVQLVTPTDNNHRLLKRYICTEGPRAGMDVRLFQGMTHLKAILVDGETLVMGSSNFHYLSYRIHQEIVAMVTDPELVADFRTRVFEPDLARSVALDGAVAATDPWAGLRRWRMQTGGWLIATLGRRRWLSPRLGLSARPRPPAPGG